MKPELDELCLTNKSALATYLMRLGVEPKLAEDLSAKAFQALRRIEYGKLRLVVADARREAVESIEYKQNEIQHLSTKVNALECVLGELPSIEVERSEA